MMQNAIGATYASGPQLQDLPIGSILRMPVAAYQSEIGPSLDWIVADKNHAGYPADSVTLLTANIIRFLSSDAMEPRHTIAAYRGGGNNDYTLSNMHVWLNSGADRSLWYQDQHDYDEPPTAEFTNGGYNPYYNLPGFLAMLPWEFLRHLLVTQIDCAAPIDGAMRRIEARIFMPSLTETDRPYAQGAPTEGSKIAYFDNTAATWTAPPTETATAHNTAPKSSTNDWRLRTPRVGSAGVFALRGGTVTAAGAALTIFGVRPVANLSGKARVKEQGPGVYSLQ